MTNKRVYIVFAFLVLLILGFSYYRYSLGPLHANDHWKSSAPKPPQDPQEIVKLFLNATFDSEATDYLTPSAAKKIYSPDIILQNLGTTKSPDSFEIKSEHIMGAKAEVIVVGHWKNYEQIGWLFNLINEDGTWKIDNFH
jgi:hypothetical protein